MSILGYKCDGRFLNLQRFLHCGVVIVRLGCLKRIRWMPLNEETKITVCMESFAQSPDWESEDDPREGLDVKPNTGVPVEVSSFPTSGKGNIASGETERDPENESNVGHALRNIDGGVGDSKVIGSGSETIHKLECAGSSGKRRRSRWGPEQCENEGTNKIRKTRWAPDYSELKMLGPTNLPNFLKSFNGSELDPTISRLRTKLMDINSRLRSSELQYDRPEEERSPSPEPVYNNLGMRINTREVRLLKKLTAQRSRIISKLAKMNPTFRTPSKPKLTEFSEPKLTKLSRKLYVPVKEYPAYNFIGLIIGPRGNTQKKMEKETGAKIHLRGKGSQRTSQEPGPTDNEDLHVYVEADNQKSLDDAVAMIEKLLIPVADRLNGHKRAQLAELARLNATYKDENKCNICKEEGHREYACPSRKSTFEGVCCDSCGSFCHPTSKCPLSISSQKCEPSWNFSGLGTGSSANIEDKSHKEIDVRNLYVGYLSQTIDSNRLKELFLPFGKVTEAKVIEDRYTGLSKGYGFVTFEDVTDSAGAVAYMNGYEMDGKCLAVRVAGHAAVADHLMSSDIAILPGTKSVLPSSRWQATPLPLPDTVMLPQAGSSVLNGEVSASFPSSSACFGSFVGSTVTSICPPFYQHPNDDDDDMELASQFPGDVKYQKSHLHKPIVETSPMFHLNTKPRDRDSFWSDSHFV